MKKISVYIIAYNEAEKIRAAINSVLWADEIIVADSHSEDNTVEIAEQMGAKVVQIPFKGFGDLRNQAIAACSNSWVFSLDSDERCTADARDEILQIVQNDSLADVYYVPRRNVFMGQWMKHSGFYPDYRQPQLFRKGSLLFKDDMVHEAYEIISSQPAGYLKNSIWQIPFKNFEEILHKANKYSTLGAEKLVDNGKTASMGKALARGIWAFFAIYILKLGILDGWKGFVIAFANFEGTYYRYAKLHERQADWFLPDSPPLYREK